MSSYDTFKQNVAKTLKVNSEKKAMEIMHVSAFGKNLMSVVLGNNKIALPATAYVTRLSPISIKQ